MLGAIVNAGAKSLVKEKAQRFITGKGKGKGKRGFRFWRGKNRMSLDERKKRLAQLKARTKCQAFGKVGHWAGDAACQMKGQGGAASPNGKKRGAHMAVTDKQNDSGSCTSVDSSDDNNEKSACIRISREGVAH